MSGGTSTSRRSPFTWALCGAGTDAFIGHRSARALTVNSSSSGSHVHVALSTVITWKPETPLDLLSLVYIVGVFATRMPRSRFDVKTRTGTGVERHETKENREMTRTLRSTVVAKRWWIYTRIIRYSRYSRYLSTKKRTHDESGPRAYRPVARLRVRRRAASRRRLRAYHTVRSDARRDARADGATVEDENRRRRHRCCCYCARTRSLGGALLRVFLITRARRVTTGRS